MIDKLEKGGGSMSSKSRIDAVTFMEKRGERFAVIPEREFRRLLRLLEELQDSLDMKQALQSKNDFLTLDELDKELTKAGLL